jgi:hypothetical protein
MEPENYIMKIDKKYIYLKPFYVWGMVWGTKNIKRKWVT